MWFRVSRVAARIRGWLDATDGGARPSRLGAAVVERGRPSARRCLAGPVCVELEGGINVPLVRTALRRELARTVPSARRDFVRLGALGVAYHF